MRWSEFYKSSIGQKSIMATTGLFLMSFLVVHLCLNATIFTADGGVLFNQTANLLRHSWWLHCLELLVFSGLLLHIGQGIQLTVQNRSKRRTAYAVSPGLTMEPARYMGILGSIVLAFLLLHLYQFWLPNIIGNDSAAGDLYQLVQATMQQWWVMVAYVAGCGAVAAHLSHGWRSAAITLGLRDRTLNLLAVVGMGCALLVPLGLAVIPVWLFAVSHA